VKNIVGGTPTAAWVGTVNEYIRSIFIFSGRDACLSRPDRFMLILSFTPHPLTPSPKGEGEREQQRNSKQINKEDFHFISPSPKPVSSRVSSCTSLRACKNIFGFVKSYGPERIRGQSVYYVMSVSLLLLTPQPITIIRVSNH